MRFVFSVLLALSTVACRVDSLGPARDGAHTLQMRIVPQLSDAARAGLRRASASPADASLGDLHIHVSHPPAASLDTIVPFPAAADSAAFTLSIALAAPSEQLTITLTLSVGSTTYYSGNSVVTANQGAAIAAPPIVMAYVGPSVSVVTPDSVEVFTGDTLRIVATPLDLAGHSIAGRTATFTTSDTTIATVSSTGLVTARLLGRVQITAASDQASAVSHLQITPHPRDAVSGGLGLVCVLTDTGQAYCAGSNGNGQLGDGTTTARTSLTPVLGSLQFTQISSGFFMSCGVTAQHAAYCWGSNDVGQLGNGSTSPSRVPVAVSGGLQFKSVKVSQGEFACGITLTAAAYCWGLNDAFIGGNTLGTGDASNRSLPTAVAGNLSFSTLAVGDGHACGLTTVGAAYCWGGEFDGELGDGTATTGSMAPVAVNTALQFIDITAGAEETCAIAVGGAPYCWGLDLAGSRGTGSTASVADASTPVAVAGNFAFVSITLGDNSSGTHACGLTAAGAAYCWGSNKSGQLGSTAAIGTCPFGSGTQPCTGTPIPVSGGDVFTAISAGITNTCGITIGRALLCWGASVGSTPPSSLAVPTLVPGNLRMP